jgi:hypothetical protein
MINLVYPTLCFLAANKPFLPYLSAMRHISQAVRLDDDSSSSTDVSYIFSDKSTNNKTLDSAPEQESDDDLEDNSDNNLILDNEDKQERLQHTTLKRLNALMSCTSNRSDTVQEPRLV